MFLSTYAQTKQEFAEWLYKQGDYFRAISIYRELQFFTKNIDSLNFYQYQIGKAYFRSGKHNNSIAEFATILERPISNELKSDCFIYLALNYLNLSSPNQALFYASEASQFDTLKSSFVTGLIYANLYNWEKAKNYFRNVSEISDSSILGNISKENLALLSGTPVKKQKSPLFALFLSALIPGLGQFYSEHYIDALQVFAFVGAFAYMSSIAYKYDHSRSAGYYNFGISVSITSLFYLANLIGAERTATYYNLKQNQDLVRKLNEKSFLVFE